MYTVTLTQTMTTTHKLPPPTNPPCAPSPINSGCFQAPKQQDKIESTVGKEMDKLRAEKSDLKGLPF